MNGQYFSESENRSDIVESTNEDANRQVVNSDPVTNNVLMDAPLIHETPIIETNHAISSPMNNPLADEYPVGGTVALVDPMHVTTGQETPMGEKITHEAPIGANAGSAAALLNQEESEHFRKRWNEIQGEFVDEPRFAVQQADALVSEVIEQITQMFTTEHTSLENQWNQGNEVSTEDLRKALQRYRSFFNRLVV
jgi:hypothetical protein